MKSPLRVLNRTRQTILVEEGAIASNPWARLVGLMGRRTLANGTGLLLKGEQAIHTFGMFIPIDVLYLDADRRVVRALDSMCPARVGPLVRKARDVLELPAGTLVATGTREGDQLDFE